VVVLVYVGIDEFHVKKSMIGDVKEIIDHEHQRHCDDKAKTDLNDIESPQNSVGIITKL
jgi:hypothetical protein